MGERQQRKVERNLRLSYLQNLETLVLFYRWRNLMNDYERPRIRIKKRVLNF